MARQRDLADARAGCPEKERGVGAVAILVRGGLGLLGDRGRFGNMIRTFLYVKNQLCAIQ